MTTQHRPPAAPRQRKPPGADKPLPREAAAVDLTAAHESSRPKMPHERDQSVNMTDGVPSQRVAQGFDDVERGVKDTSRGDEADSAYNKLKGRGPR